MGTVIHNCGDTLAYDTIVQNSDTTLYLFRKLLRGRHISFTIILKVSYTSTGTIPKVWSVSICTVLHDTKVWLVSITTVSHDTKVSSVSIHVVSVDTKSIIYIDRPDTKSIDSTRTVPGDTRSIERLHTYLFSHTISISFRCIEKEMLSDAF